MSFFRRNFWSITTAVLVLIGSVLSAAVRKEGDDNDEPNNDEPDNNDEPEEEENNESNNEPEEEETSSDKSVHYKDKSVISTTDDHSKNYHLSFPDITKMTIRQALSWSIVIGVFGFCIYSFVVKPINEHKIKMKEMDHEQERFENREQLTNMMNMCRSILRQYSFQNDNYMMVEWKKTLVDNFLLGWMIEECEKTNNKEEKMCEGRDRLILSLPWEEDKGSILYSDLSNEDDFKKEFDDGKNAAINGDLTIMIILQRFRVGLENALIASLRAGKIPTKEFNEALRPFRSDFTRATRSEEML